MKEKIFYGVVLLILSLIFTSEYGWGSNPLVRYPALNSDVTKLAFSCQGDIWTVETEGGRAYRLTLHEAYEYRPIWSPDNRHFAFCSNRFGNDDIFTILAIGVIPKQITYYSKSDILSDWTQDNRLFFESNRAYRQIEWDDELQVVSTGGGTPSRLMDAFGYEPTLSPDGKKITFIRGLGTLIVADINEAGILSNQRVLIDGWATPTEVVWSPDSRWIAYSLEDLTFNSEVYIHAVDGGRKPVNVSMHPRLDYNPVWSTDGTKLGFISQRNNRDSDIWFVWLRKSDWQKTQEDWEEYVEETIKEEKGNNKKKGKKKTKGEKKEIKPVIIDFDDIHERLVQVTKLEGNEEKR